MPQSCGEDLGPRPLGRRLRGCGAGGVCPRLGSARRARSPGTVLDPPAPPAQAGRASGFVPRPPSERRKRTQQSPINYWILLRNLGQAERCRDPRPCVRWLGESFSSRAGAKHLQPPPRSQSRLLCRFILPPGIPALSLLPARSRALRHPWLPPSRQRTPCRRGGSRLPGRRGDFGRVLVGTVSSATALVLASASSPESCGGKMHRSALLW